MGTITVRTRSLVWFALGAATMLVATVVWMSAWSADAAPGDSDTTVVPITSCRLTDTRPNMQVGPRNTPLGAEETYSVQVQDASTKCVGAVPASATGLLLNVTAVQMTQPTFLSIWDQGPFPGTSSLNPVPGPPMPNAVTTKLADDDTFRIYNLAGTTHVIIDIVGYLTPTSLTDVDDRLNANSTAIADLETANRQPIVVPAAAFVPDDDNEGSFYTFVNGEYQIRSRSCHRAPVHIPVGATITAVEFYVNDPSATGRIFELSLRRHTLGAGDLEFVAEQATTISFDGGRTTLVDDRPNLVVAASDAFAITICGDPVTGMYGVKIIIQ